MLYFVTSVNCSLYWKTVFREENHPVCFLNWAGYTPSVKTHVSDDVGLVAAAAPGRLLLGGRGRLPGSGRRGTGCRHLLDSAAVQQMSRLGIQKPGPR